MAVRLRARCRCSVASLARHGDCRPETNPRALYVMAKRDPFPPDAAIQEANAALVNLVRRHFPMGFYRQNTNWELWSAALLVRMTETVESAMVLMEDAHEPDGRMSRW
jgi:hypothetical protein